jgi:UDP-N-acetylmuramate-alanine ligase
MAELGFERARYAPSEEAAIKGVLEDLRPGDMILTVGAGSVGRIGDTLAETIRGRSVRQGAVQG